MTVEDWLGKDNTLGISIWEKKYRHNNESFDEWLDRVSGKNTKIRELIKQKKFLFGGRTLSNRGTKKGSLNNCYSIGYVPDSLDGIMDVATKIAMTFKAQGGQGLSLSKIRPKGSLINNTFKSDGIVPFMEIFNTVTESVSQGGSRKGALMMSLDINHPEIETFMTIKSDHQKITKANLSVEIDDSFMKKVIHGDADANHTFNILCEQACKHAEPGVLFTDRLRNYNLMQYIDSYQIETTNPCGEQPLPKNGACGLCSINLSEYVLNPFTEEASICWEDLKNDVYEYVKTMDDVIDENLPYHALDEQREVAKHFRNMGIGVMGIQDMLIKLGLKYGSYSAIMHVSRLMHFIMCSAVNASALLAKERGAFPEYSDKILESPFFKNLKISEDVIDLIKKYGLRNSTLLSVAPTGSIGTMLNISSGVEPWFAMHYTRNTKSLDGKESSYEVWAPIAEEANKRNWHPETLVTSNELTWKEHIGMQAAIQNFVDTAVSKTINMPANTTPKDVREAYIYAWNKGLKGLTVYVDGSRDPILTTKEKEEKKKDIIFYDSITPVSRKQMGITHGCTFCKKCACGTLYVTINKDSDDHLVELFTHTSKGGICQANLNAETRMASLALRSGVKVSEVVDQLKGISCPACTAMKAKGKKIDGISCADIIAKTIEEFSNINTTTKENTHKVELPVPKGNFTKCPGCGEMTLIHEAGCVICGNCGYSKCE